MDNWAMGKFFEEPQCTAEGINCLISKQKRLFQNGLMGSDLDRS